MDGRGYANRGGHDPRDEDDRHGNRTTGQLTDEELEKELAFAEGFDLADADGRVWLAALRAEARQRERGHRHAHDGIDVNTAKRTALEVGDPKLRQQALEVVAVLEDHARDLDRIVERLVLIEALVVKLSDGHGDQGEVRAGLLRPTEGGE